MSNALPLWVPRQVGQATRWHRDGSRYTMRYAMEPGAGARPHSRKWVLYAGDDRVWEVQPMEHLSAAIEAAEEWISRG